MQLTLDIQNESDDKDVPDNRDFNHWVKLPLDDLDQDAEVSIRLVNKTESQQLNAQYRDKNNPTNVLSFPSVEIPGMPNEHIGDLVICVAVVKREASEQHKTISAHFAHITIHGILHLLGYDHLTDEDAREMELLEISLLEKLNYNNPYEDTFLNEQ